MKALGWSASTVSLARGTYSASKVCVTPAGGKFAADVSFKIAGEAFKTLPAEWKAKLGDVSTCGQLGTASTTQASHFDLSFTKTDAKSKFTGLPLLHATVTSGKSTVTVPTTCGCVKGGLSDPLLVSTGGALPFADITVKLKLKVKAKDAKVEPSAGMLLSTVPAASQSATFNSASKSSSYVQFSCAADFKTGAVDWDLSGADKLSWELSGASLTASPLAKVAKDANAKVTVAVDTAKSTSGSTYFKATCVDKGFGWVRVSAVADTSAVSVAD